MLTKRLLNFPNGTSPLFPLSSSIISKATNSVALYFKEENYSSELMLNIPIQQRMVEAL